LIAVALPTNGKRPDIQATLFMAPLRLNTIQIPTKVEVYIAPPGSEQQQQHDGATAAPPSLPSKRLGYLSFDSNERSGHQARELKSVHVSVDAVALRLVVHRCHVNKLNIYNQVRGGALATMCEARRRVWHGMRACNAGATE
jgi:centrosomal protein CEP104